MCLSLDFHFFPACHRPLSTHIAGSYGINHVQFAHSFRMYNTMSRIFILDPASSKVNPERQLMHSPMKRAKTLFVVSYRTGPKVSPLVASSGTYRSSIVRSSPHKSRPV